MSATAEGRISRVTGPLVEVTGLSGLAMSELVEVGREGLVSEVVAIRGATATLQAYEYTGGLAPGDPARARGRQLSARLGPHLLGGVFDGLLRPLDATVPWLEPGRAGYAATARKFDFTPEVREGDLIPAGGCLGTVANPGQLRYRVMPPPGVSGPVTRLHDPGPVTDDEVLALAGEREVRLATSWPVRTPRPFRERLVATAPLRTGQRVVDALFPISRGGTTAVPGGFGTGKTVLLQQVTKWCDADVIVYVGCGERGNELADMLSELSSLADPRTGGLLTHRTVIIANTSNMPLMAREASVYTGVTVAEYFRDMGLDVVVVADSTSRWAEALREFASRKGELPAEEGYPASLSSALAAFYERAGRVVTSAGWEGSVTIIGAVSPAGGDITEPVTAYTQRFVRGLWMLDRDLAYARHYPAVSWAGSFSRDTAAIASWHARHGDPEWEDRRTRLTATLAEADRLGELAELMGITALPAAERMTILAGRLIREGILQQSALSDLDASCSGARTSALVDAVLTVAGRCQELAGHGVSPAVIEEQDFSPVLRAKDEAETTGQIAQRREMTLDRLSALLERT